MGYYTDYSLDAGPFAKRAEADAFIQDLVRVSGYHFVVGDFNDEGYISATNWDAKWYDCREDVQRVSVDYPHVTVDLRGVGEEPGDMWKMRARAGVTERVAAQVVFSEFAVLK